MTESKVIDETVSDSSLNALNRCDSSSGIAQVAHGIGISDKENALLVSIEARLTDEMRGLAVSIREFVNRFQLIRKEIPEGAQFSQLIALFFEFYALQTAVIFSQPRNKSIFLEDGAAYLDELGLQLNDFIREVYLDDRKFLAIAFVDEFSNSNPDCVPKLNDC